MRLTTMCLNTDQHTRTRRAVGHKPQIHQIVRDKQFYLCLRETLDFKPVFRRMRAQQFICRNPLPLTHRHFTERCDFKLRASVNQHSENVRLRYGFDGHMNVGKVKTLLKSLKIAPSNIEINDTNVLTLSQYAGDKIGR